MMERWTEGPLIVSDCMDGFVREGEGAVDREKQQGRKETVWPIDPIKLRPSLLCGHASRISVSRLGLILVSLAGHLLLRKSKFVHLLLCCQLQRKRHKIVV